MFHRILLHRYSIYPDNSPLCLIKPGDQLDQSCLGRACLPDDPQSLSRLYMEGNIGKNILFSILFIFKPYMVKVDFSPFYLNVSGLFICRQNTQALKELYAQKGFSFEGIFSHFAKAFEGAYTITKTQLERFLQVTEALRAAGCPIGIRHIANSNAALRFPQTRLDAVRVGSALTGRLFPKPPVPLRPAARYLAQVVECKTLQKGDTTGYAAVCRVQKTTRAAIVAVGSENGYGYVGGPDNYLLRDMVYYFRELFRLSRKLPGVTYQGKRLPLVGRVGNQYTLFDASGTDIHPGDYVEAQVPTVIPRTNLVFVEE